MRSLSLALSLLAWRKSTSTRPVCLWCTVFTLSHSLLGRNGFFGNCSLRPAVGSLPPHCCRAGRADRCPAERVAELSRRCCPTPSFSTSLLLLLHTSYTIVYIPCLSHLFRDVFFSTRSCDGVSLISLEAIQRSVPCP